MTIQTTCYEMAKNIETRWDGITTVAATAGLVLVSITGILAGDMAGETVLLVIAALSGIGGYSMHNVVRRSNERR